MALGIGEYLAIAAVLALSLHLLIRQFDVASVGGSILCGMGYFANEMYLSGFEIKPGWAVPVVLVSSMVALPVCCMVGLPIRAIRLTRVAESAPQGR